MSERVWRHLACGAALGSAAAAQPDQTEGGEEANDGPGDEKVVVRARENVAGRQDAAVAKERVARGRGQLQQRHVGVEDKAQRVHDACGRREGRESVLCGFWRAGVRQMDGWACHVPESETQ